MRDVDHIDRNLLCEHIHQLFNVIDTNPNLIYLSEHLIQSVIKDQPSLQVDHNTYGEWLYIDEDYSGNFHIECSVCHSWKQDKIKTPWCPQCGTRMVK